VTRASARRRDRQVVRVLGILKLLLEGGRPTVRDLAARFKTFRQTIYRDLRALEEIGYPLTGEDDSGRDGGEHLLDQDRREPERRLVHQEHLGPRHQPPRDRQHLLLASGERPAERVHSCPSSREFD
jgi:predicted DNA-binding transcriptional regulator YafY